jgi:hypothetical protein
MDVQAQIRPHDRYGGEEEIQKRLFAREGEGGGQGLGPREFAEQVRDAQEYRNGLDEMD